MKAHKKYQRVDNQQRKPPEQCQLSWNCPLLLKKMCNNRHDPDDFNNADSLEAILKRNSKDIIVIFDRISQKHQRKPLCLFDPYLPIRIVGVIEPPMEPGQYYIGSFQEVFDRKAILKFSKALGSFGHWATEAKIFNQFCLAEYILHEKGNNFTFRGQIKVNDKDKILIGDRRKNHHYFLQNVNAFSRYPVMQDSHVEYYEQHNRPCLTKITHPREIRLSGIIQIDNNSQFYFIPRNTHYDDMNLYTFPPSIEQTLEKYSYLFPYSIHKQQKMDKKDKEEINKLLNGLLLKGFFKEWLLNCRYPLIKLEEDQIVERNLKNMKNAIIFEAGIQMKRFSANQKTEAERIVKKFDINSYNKRSLLCNVLTVDNKQTKCHDDALYIEQLQNKEFMVEIHIADAAELIKEDSKLNKDIKSRDQTIYIKNYYQPMVPEPLKSLLSLSNKQEKLAFSLKFKINSEGFVDFRSVDFFKSRIKVEKNLSHELLVRQPNLFPELFKVDELINSSQLIDTNYILQCESKSETALARLICLSAIIPTFVLERNIIRSTKLKEQLNEYIKKMVEEKSASMEKWEDEVIKINKVKKESDLIKKDIKKIEDTIKKELDKMRQTFLNDIKKEQNLLKKEQKEKKGRKKITKNVDQLQETSEQQSVLIDDGTSVLKASIASDQKIDIDVINDAIEKELKQKRVKAIKEVRLNQISSESEQSQSEEDDYSEIGTQDEETRMKNAEGGKRYLERIFGVFKIDMKWKSLKEINYAFTFILSQSKSRIYKEYFKRMQIMNKQHFKYIIKIVQQDKQIELKRQKEIKGKTSENTKRSNKEEKEESRNLQKVDKKKEEQVNESKKKYRRVDQPSQIKEEKQQQKNQQDKCIKEKPKIVNQANIRLIKKIEEKKIEQSSRDRNKIKEDKSQEKDQKNNDSQPQLKHEEKRKRKQQRGQKQRRIQFSDEQKEVKNKIIKQVQQNQKRYIEKYLERFKTSKQFDISDDQIFGDEQNQQILKKYRKIMRKSIFNLLKTVKKERPKRFRQPYQKQKKKNKQSRNIHKVDDNWTVRDEMDLMVQKYFSSANTFSAEQKEVKNKIIKQVQQNQKRYIEKYLERFKTSKQFDISDDQIFGEEQNQQILKKYRKIMRKSIFNLLKTVKKERPKRFRQPHQKQKKKNKQSRNIHKVDDNWTVRDEMDLMVQKYFSSAKPEIKQKQQDDFEEKIVSKVEQTLPLDNKTKVIQCKVEESTTLIQSGNPTHQKQILQVCQDEINMLIQQYLPIDHFEQLDEEQKEQIEVQQPVLKKKQIKAKVDAMIKPFSEELKVKYASAKAGLKQKLKQSEKLISESSQYLKEELSKSEKDYNLIRFLSIETEKEQKKEVQTQKKGKKSKKETKQAKKGAFSDFLENFQEYAKKANFKFAKMKEKQLDSFLEAQFNTEQICSNDNIQEINRQASRVAKDQESLLKWNNPIRSYESLQVMRIIKKYDWLFRGQLHPTDVILFGEDIKGIKKELKELEKYRQEKIAAGQTNKKAKEANRQIAKLEFHALMKKDKQMTYTFLTITSRPSANYREVYHPILQEIKVEKMKGKFMDSQLFKEVQGRVSVKSQFPLEFTAELI